MKRKDWKIKKLTKGIYDKSKKNKNKKIKQEKLYMLRKLFLKKNVFLLKKNLVSNYFLYNSFLFDFFKKKNKYYNNFWIFREENYNIYNPKFSFSKKLFNLEFFLKNLLIENNLNYVFINKNFTRLNYFKGNKLIVFENDSFLKNLINESEKNEINLPIELKYPNKNYSLGIQLNYFLNFNLYISLNQEIYKILILAHLNLLIK